MSDYKLVKQDIRTAGGALAYTRGQLITADAVKANGWEEHVTGRDTQEARAVLADITGDVLPEPESKQTRAARSAGTSTTNAEE